MDIGYASCTDLHRSLHPLSVCYSRNQPRRVGNRVYIGASDGTLYGLNPESGEITWSHTTGAPLFSTAALSGGVMIVTDFGGNVYAFTLR
ncbi:MAG: PQQ-binding-like beta-propeller repeat protein [Tannerellaceae bacterium]|nr:PQQ-binding-like beta-propeller repeat protein [Tannerellaceae bacterium]